MKEKELEIYLYIGNSQKIIDWLKMEGVKTKEQAKQKLSPLVKSNLLNIALSIRKDGSGSFLGTATCLSIVINSFNK